MSDCLVLCVTELSKEYALYRTTYVLYDYSTGLYHLFGKLNDTHVIYNPYTFTTLNKKTLSNFITHAFSSDYVKVVYIYNYTNLPQTMKGINYHFLEKNKNEKNLISHHNYTDLDNTALENLLWYLPCILNLKSR